MTPGNLIDAFPQALEMFLLFVFFHFTAVTGLGDFLHVVII